MEWDTWREQVKDDSRREWEQWEYERQMRRRLRILRATFVGVGIAIGASLILTRLLG